MPELQKLDVDAHDRIFAALQRDGGVIVERYLDSEKLERVRDALAIAIEGLPWCNTYNAYEDEFFGAKTKRLHGLLQYGPELESCLMHPLPLALAPRVAAAPVIMSTGELMAIGPEETRQRLHRDADSWLRAGLDRDFLFSVNIALTDFRRDNGATVVVPGSHRWPGDRDAVPDEFAYAEMPAGSALIYLGGVIHSGGENVTQETRMGLYFGYIPSWLRPLENPVQTHPPETLEHLGQETRNMLGLSEEGFIAYV